MCIEAKSGRHSGVGLWLCCLLEHRYFPWLVAVVAVLLCLPALRLGWLFDDDFHRLALTRPDLSVLSRSPAELFVFVEGDVAANRLARTMGFLPWWSSENLRVAFFRPLTGLTHWLDYQLWPDQPALMHLHSLFWYGAVVVTAAVFFRRMFGASCVAGLAALLFAVDDAHALPAVWIANRNALLGVFFGLMTLILHDRWRSEGSWLCALLAPLMFLVGLLSKESTVAIAAYAFAYSLFLDRGRWVSRVASLAPCAVVGIVWWVIYKRLGYGTAGSTWYVDPGEEPMVFARAVAAHAPNLLAWQWLVPSGLQWSLCPQGARCLWWVVMALLAIIAAALVPLLKRECLARFWALGMLLSVLAACSAYPWDRLLTFVGIGGVGLLAQFIAATVRSFDRKRIRLPLPVAAPAICAILFVIHLLIAPVHLARTAGSMADARSSLERVAASLPPTPHGDPQTVPIANSPTYASFAYGVLNRLAQGKPYFRPTFVLGSGPRPIELHRRDKQTLLVRPHGGFFAPGGNPHRQAKMAQILFNQRRSVETLDRFYRDSLPTSVGQRTQLMCATVEITAITEDGRPAEVAFNFLTTLETPLFHWLQWRNGRYVPFKVPAVGQRLTLPAATIGQWRTHHD